MARKLKTEVIPEEIRNEEEMEAVAPEVMPEETPSGNSEEAAAENPAEEVPPEAEDAVPEIRLLELPAGDGVIPDKEIPPPEAVLSGETARSGDISEGTAGGDVLREVPENPRAAFERLDVRRLDRGLSTEQRQEWEKIYASYRAKSILTGTVAGVDRSRFAITGEDGRTVEREVFTPVVIDYRVKVLIPETELWMPGEERSEGVVRNLMGAKIDYVITQIDREGEVAIASRRLALMKRRRMLAVMRAGNRPGSHIRCDVLSAGRWRCLVSCGGYDIILSQRELSYAYIQDLREVYHPGTELEAVIQEFEPGEGRLAVSVKEANPNPMDGAEKRHPVGCRRIATISGKYKGGIFCRLDDGLTCLALYSNNQLDTNFLPGDRVGVYIARIDVERGLFFGRIVTKL